MEIQEGKKKIEENQASEVLAWVGYAFESAFLLCLDLLRWGWTLWGAEVDEGGG